MKVTLSINESERNNAEGYYDECRALFIVMLSVVMLSVVMLSVVMLSVVMLNVIMLSVVAPFEYPKLFLLKIIFSIHCSPLIYFLRR